LSDDVRFDWTGFNNKSERSRESLVAVEQHIEEWLRRLTIHTRRDQKIEALEVNRAKLKILPDTSRDYVGSFINEVQEKIPTIGQETLNHAVSVVCTLEEARSGRELLESLAKFNPSEMDALYEIIKKWNIRDAKLVLDELHWRLNLIAELERLTDDPSADELHQLQPLFKRGLWIFGPEYETVEFTSNRSLLTVINKLLIPDKQGTISEDMERKRPDFVVLPDRSVGIYSRDGYDTETGDVKGIEKVLVIELKRGGFEVTRNETWQVDNYATAIRESGKLQPNAKIVCFVLGSTVSPSARKIQTGEEGEGNQTVIFPRSYNMVLRQAHARTFRLMDRIRELHDDIPIDPDVTCVLEKPIQLCLDGQENSSASD
jgi:hypothetical protein